MFTYTPLLGAQSTSRASQSILELDGGVKVLVDVGWDENFDTRQLAQLEKHVSSLSFILLTHATIPHIGAFAHCCKHVPYFSQVPVYATAPVIAFGRTLLQDLYSSSPLAATFIPSTASPEDSTSANDSRRTDILRQAPNVEEISRYFSLITPLKYSQPLQPAAAPTSPSLEGLSLTAYNAGHTLGGTIWHIQHGMESIVYAVDWNQAKENVIAGAAWFGGVGGSEVLEQLRKPTALVCSSAGGDRAAPGGGRRARDDALLGHIRGCLSKGGSVLMPTDTSARVLELAWILERTWHESAKEIPFKDTRVYMASRSGNATMRHARSLLEWMDDSIVREFEGEEEAAAQKTHRRNGSRQANGTSKSSRPFEFRHVRMIERKTQLERALKYDGPKVILASDLSLDWGFSQPLLETFASDVSNLILLTERPAAGADTKSPSRILWSWLEERASGVALEKSSDNVQLEQIHGGARVLEMSFVERAALDEQENQQYQQYIATQRQLQASLGTIENAADAVDDNLDDASSSSSDESDDEQQGRALNVSAALGHGVRNKVTLTDEDLGVNILVRKKNIFDFDVRNKKGRNAVFPYNHARKRGDDFGDFIKPEDFLREEEKEEQTGSGDSGPGRSFGQKRKWDEQQQKDNERSRKRQQPGRNDKDNGAAADEGSSDDNSEDEDVDEEPEIVGFDGPAKAVFSVKQITLNARLAFVDFAGLHDQRSLQMLIPLIGPKKLIFTGGSSRETAALASDCKELLGMKSAGVEDELSAEVLTPTQGQTVDASVDTNAWVVKLTRNLARMLNWQAVKSIGVVALQGQLKGEAPERTDIEEELKSKKLKLGDESSQKASSINRIVPILDTLPPSLAASTRSMTQPIHVGDMRLADLRRIMNVDGHSAEFRGEGTLLVDSMIAVRKLASGKIIVEGAPVNSVAAMTTRAADSFTEVKQKIYAGLAVVAAG